MQKENQEKDTLLLEKRFIELSRTAYQRDIITYTDFLNLNEQNILHTLPKNKLYSDYVFFGGYGLAERQMAAFIPDALYLRGENEIGYPFEAVRIFPSGRKFAEELSHRDYLGAILNLGIDRSKTGDIIRYNGDAVVFVSSDLAGFLCENLTRIRHTAVMAECIPLPGTEYSPQFEEIKGTVASVRLDSLLALAFSASRTKLSGLIEGAKVFVNGKLITSNGYQPKEGDIISVRGMGKFRYAESGSRSKKNRIYVSIQKYI